MAGTETPAEGRKAGFLSPFGINMPDLGDFLSSGENRNLLNSVASFIPQSLTPQITSVYNKAFGRKAVPDQVEEAKKPEMAVPFVQKQVGPNLNRAGTFGKMVRSQGLTMRKGRNFDEINTPYMVPNLTPQKLVDVDMLEEEGQQPALPSPIYLPDFNLLEDKGGMQYLPQTQLNKQPLVKKSAPTNTAITVLPPQMNASMYIPHSDIATFQPLPETRIAAFKDFEDYLTQEKDLHGMRAEFFQRDQQASLFESAVQLLKQTQQQLANDTRSHVQPHIPQTELSRSTNFFEFQPHLIYTQHMAHLPHSQQSMRAVLPVGLSKAGFFPELNMGYAFDERNLTLWKQTNPVHTRQTLPEFSSRLQGIKAVEDAKSQVLLLVLTTEEIHLYSVKHNADLTFVLAPFLPPVSTDRTRYRVACQTKTKQIFIGGDNGKVSELKIDGVNVKEAGDSKSKAAMAIRYLKGKVIGDGFKMRKVDKSISKEQESMISKFIGNFLEKDTQPSKYVSDMIENVAEKCLIVGVSDSKVVSNLEFFDLSSENFHLIRRVPISELFDDLQKRVPIHASSAQEITKLSLAGTELTLYLLSGVSLTLTLSFGTTDLGARSLSFKLLTAMTPPFEHLIDRYESLFDSDFIPDQLEEYHPWKPLVAKPQFLSATIKINSQVDILDIQVSEDGKTVFLIKIANNLGGTKNYLMLIQNNYRRGTPYKYSQYLVGMTEIHSSNSCHALQLHKNEQGRTTIKVLTDAGHQDYLIPESEDIMLQYLELLVQFQLEQPLGESTKVQRVQKDFEQYLQGQDLEVSLRSLLRLILSRSRQHSREEHFFRSSFAAAFYTNQDGLMRAGSHRVSPFMQRDTLNLDAHQFRNNLKSVARYVQSYLFTTETANLVPITADVAALAQRYFLDLSSTRERFPSNLVTDRAFLQAYRDYQHFIAQRGPNSTVLETERFTVIYREVVEILRPIWEAKVIKVGEKETAERGMTIGQTECATSKLRVIARFIQENQEQLGEVSIEADFFTYENVTGVTVPKNLKGDVQSLLSFISKVYQGLEVIKVHIYQDKVLNSMGKDLTKTLSALPLSDFLVLGVQNPEVCALLEPTIIQLDAVETQQMKGLADFLPPEALSLFLAKKYLSAAKALKAQKVKEESKVKALGQAAHQEFMKYPLRVNLNVALEDYLQLDMLLESITLCLKCVDIVEDIRKLTEVTAEGKDEVMMSVMKSRQGQQDSAIKVILEIIQEIILRIDTAEGRRKGEMKEVPKDSLAEKVRKRLADATLTVDYLKDLKARILRLSARTQSEYFHIQLYELLLSYGLTHDLRIIQTPHVKSLVQKLMVAPETGTLTEDQKLNLSKGKLEMTYLNYVNAQLYGESFLAIMNQVCFQSDGLSKIEIGDRIIWLQKAEGALQSCKTQLLARQRLGTSLNLQTDDTEITDDLVKKLYFYKDYFLVLLQLRDAAIESNQSLQLADADVLEKLKYQILDPNDLCQIAIQLRQWTLYLRVLEINELTEYRADGKTNLQYKTREKYDGTQDRINFMYRQVVGDGKSLSIAESQMRYQRIIKCMRELKEFAQTKKTLVVDMFPAKLILTLLEDANQEILILLRVDSAKIPQTQPWDQLWDPSVKTDQLDNSWSLFWHLDLLISFKCPAADTAFDALFSRVTGSLTPERYLSLAYLIIKYQLSADAVLRRLNMLQVLDWLTQSISDELLYSKDYIEKVQTVVTKLEGRLRPQQALQGNEKHPRLLVVEGEHHELIPQQ